jgi:hypothetical protein
MREFFRRWLGIEEMRTSLEVDKKEAHEFAQLQAVAFAELLGRVESLERLLAEPAEVLHPSECPNGHTGLMVMAVLEHVDTATGGRKPKGFGLYCPKCKASFYAMGGVKWNAEGNATEVAAGMEPHTPPGAVRDPEIAPRPLRFRR